VDVLDLIETPENVELEQRLAGIGSRFIAGLVDGLILTGISIALAIVFTALAMLDPFESRFGLGVALYALAVFLLFWGYFVFFEYRTNGQTPGKKTVRIRVVREGGMPITFRDVAVRNLLRIVDAFPSMVVCVIGGIAMFATKKCQRLGDLAAGTVVVSEQSVDYSAKSDRRVTAEWEADAGAAALRATGLTPEEYRVLSNYWLRRSELTLEARYNVLPKLLAPILARTGQALADGRLETLEAYVELLMRQAWYAENEERARQYQQYQQRYNQGQWP
jgi:uncharacterized RDD family membrane protein YckC